MPLLENNARVGRFVVQRLIKHNLYTETYRAVDENNTPYFLKVFVMSRIGSKLVNPQTKIVKEIEYSRLLTHRNIISFVENGEFEHSEGACQYYVTNYLNGSVLLDYVSQRGPLPEAEAIKIFREILAGLAFLHSLTPPLCHNDIDPSNIIIGEVDGEAKIIDLGHTSERCSGRVHFDVSDIDIIYHANENMVNIFDEQGDLFSACAVLYFMLSGKAPWSIEFEEDKTYKERFWALSMLRKKNHPDIDSLNVSERVKALLRAGMESVANERAKSIAELLQMLDAPDDAQPKSKDDGKGGRSKFDDRGKGDDGSGRGSGPKDASDPNQFVLEVRRGDGNGFRDIAGMQELKDFLTQKVIFVISNEELAKEYHLTPPNGMLLYGPPGCGKTYFAEKFAEETGYNFALIKASDIASTYVHGSQSMIGMLFKQAEKHRPIVLCFDEFDALVPDRSGYGMSAHYSGEVNEFLTQLNNCAKRGIFVVATSNRPDKIDPAILRTGRIDRSVYVPQPDIPARMEMFKMYVNNRPALDDINYEDLARRTEGYIASDIAYIVNDAAMTAAFSRTKISHELLVNTIKSVSPSLGRDQFAIYEAIRARMDTSNRRNVATHRPMGYTAHVDDK